jgi:hypothetical protein
MLGEDQVGAAHIGAEFVESVCAAKCLESIAGKTEYCGCQQTNGGLGPSYDRRSFR